MHTIYEVMKTDKDHWLYMTEKKARTFGPMLWLALMLALLLIGQLSLPS